MPLTVKQVEELGGYSVIYCDPAWKYNDKGSNGAAEDHYPTMTLEELQGLPVNRLAAKDAILFMWGVFPMTVDAIVLMESWGFELKTVAFVLVKVTKNGKIHYGLGRYTRGNAEPCWLAVKGKPYHLIQNHSVRQIIERGEFANDQIVAARDVHSRKPPEARDRIVELCGDVPRLEMFARERFEGWDAWGNEVESDVIL